MGLRDWLSNLFSPSNTGDKLPPPDQGHGLDELARRIRIPVQHFDKIKPVYHQFEVPKRTGGTRTITAPGAEFKSFQRTLLKNLFARLPVHPAAVGFRKDHSIATHAATHAYMPVVLKMDIRDFFGSTSNARIHAYFRHIGWNDDAAMTLVDWCTYDGGLPQGAPTSPILSNAVNYQLDSRLVGLASACSYGLRAQNPKTLAEVRSTTSIDVFYSRYADDITFSFSMDNHEVIQRIIYVTQKIVEDHGYRLHTRKKLRIMRQHDRQMVTGLVVNNGVRLPRKTRRWLRAVEHHRANGRPTSITDEQLRGWHALQGMIETIHLKQG